MRERMVTRTIVSTQVKALVFSESKDETIEKVYTLSGEIDKETAKKVLRKNYETDDESIVKVISIETKEQIYGMSETDFIAHAHIMKDYFNKA